MKAQLLLCVFALLLDVVSGSVLVFDYPISLYYADSRLSTLFWLRPAYCLYEQWTKETLDPNEASWKTATVEVEVKPLGRNNSIYRTGQSFSIPRCSPMIEEPLITEDLAYQVGPTLICLNGSCTKPILPGQGYRVRYLLYNQAQKLLVTTRWSQPFHTRDLPLSYRSIDDTSRSVSSGLVVISVLLSITVFLLLGAAWSLVGHYQGT